MEEGSLEIKSPSKRPVTFLKHLSAVEISKVPQDCTHFDTASSTKVSVKRCDVVKTIDLFNESFSSLCF